MHIDWFIVYVFGVTIALCGYGLWLWGKDEKRRGDDVEKAKDSPTH